MNYFTEQARHIGDKLRSMATNILQNPYKAELLEQALSLLDLLSQLRF